MKADRNGYAMIAALAFTALLGGLASLAFMANTQLLRDNLAFQERLLERAGEVTVGEMTDHQAPERMGTAGTLSSR